MSNYRDLGTVAKIANIHTSHIRQLTVFPYAFQCVLERTGTAKSSSKTYNDSEYAVFEIMIEVKLFLFKLISMRQYNYVHRADHSSVQTGMYACGFPSK